MQNSHPENIDDLERFYQHALGDMDIEPPAEMWDRINTKMGRTKKPFYKSSGFFVGITAFLFTSVTLILLQLKTDDQKVIDDFKQQHQIIPVDSQESSSETKEQKDPFKAPDNVAKQNKNNASTTNKNTIQPVEKGIVADTVKNGGDVTSPVNIGTDINDQKNTETVIPDKEKTPEKKPKSFYEKHSQEYKDSTRQLFVPNK